MASLNTRLRAPCTGRILVGYGRFREKIRHFSSKWKKGAMLPYQLTCGGVRAVKGRLKRPKFKSEGRRKLRQIRSKLGHTQHSFAPLLGLIPSTYEKYERGLHKLPPGLLERAQLLETPPASEAASVPVSDELDQDEVVVASPLEEETAFSVPSPSTEGGIACEAVAVAQGVGEPINVPWGASAPTPEMEIQKGLGEARYERWVQACWIALLAVALFIIARIAEINLGWTNAWQLGPNDEGLAVSLILLIGLLVLLGQETLRRVCFGLPLRNQRGS
ncbi:helix-turn-helix transcriptional regulator [Gemmobacter sp. 24YEA27]|uniref:helix-turn-helix domain-containing protein n=1 Tax=Gemmobacter sp. 24YEA27 TaxID=3040672 RepID=UPI0024B3B173|nr:helix-turn-helix transcriptional regulator [Gemmobacter sp. 24YEA27]